MKNSKLITGIHLLLVLFMFNCKTPTSLLQDGDYDEAVYQAIKNLRKKKRKKEKDILVVEQAYRRITSRDMNEIANLKAEGQAANWVRINRLHNDIKNRQDLISPYLPLIATKTHYKADFRFVKIVPMEIDSRKRAAEYYYVLGNRLMKKADAGNKVAARSAFRKFEKVHSYFAAYKNTSILSDRAFEIGIDKVLLETRNSSFSFIPSGFERELLSFNERTLNDKWIKYYTEHNAPQDIDYKVIIDITDIDISPERIREDNYTLQKELSKTVRQVVKPSNKVFVRDTTISSSPEYADVTTYFNVFADVIDVYQTKAALVSAKVSFYDKNLKRLLSTERVNAEIEFNHIASTFRGDRRALTKAVLNRIGGTPVRFPSDSDMVMDAADQLKREISKCIRKKDSYVYR